MTDRADAETAAPRGVEHRLAAVALHHRTVIALLFAAAFGFGIWALLRLPVDAFPDTSSVQVQVNTVAEAYSGEEIEQQITLPVELALGGLPGLVEVRSVSKFGLSQVVATFSDATGVYDARQFILERLATVSLPDGIEPPALGPVSSGLGEVFAYTMRSTDPDRSLESVRTLHDWVIKPELLKVAGVAEINAWGGYERQYHVVVDPKRLRGFGLTLADVFDALERNNRNVGGGQLVSGGEAMLIHGRARVHSADDIAQIVLRAAQGVPVHIADVADVRIGHEIRRGAVTAFGEGEAVLGLGYMLMGENSRDVAVGLRRQLEHARAALPPDIEVRVVYDRTELVQLVLDTVRHNLIAGAALVGAVLFLTFRSFAAGLIVAVTIPMAMLFAASGMYAMGIAASLLSLGAIDFGILVDGSVVMTDANLRALQAARRRLGRPLTRAERLAAILASSREVMRPILFGMGIILIVFLPLLTLQGTEGKMFRPMAATFIFALIGALVIAVLLSPILSYFGLPARAARRSDADAAAPATGLRGYLGYRALLRSAIRWRGIVVGLVLVLLAATGVLAARLGGEFIPRLSEGAIAVNVIRLPGIAIEESVAYNTRMERMLLEAFPDEIEAVWSRIGTAEVATDPMGIELTDVFITLTPRDQWTRASSQTELVAAMEETLAGLPGQNLVFTQPIELRMNELTSGMRADVGVKIIGDDFDQLIELAGEIEHILSLTPGAEDVSADQVTGLPTLRIDVDPEAIGRHGIPADEVLAFVEALGNRKVGDVVEGQRIYPLAVRLPDELRTDRRLLADTVIPASSGAELPLSALARIEAVTGLANINREWGRRIVRVQANVRERDVMSFVREAQARIAAELPLPEGYLIEWSGQFQHLAASQRRLMVVVPLTLGLVFILLYLSLQRIHDVLVVYSGIPFAVVGGVAALYFRGIPFSVSAAIGFIALSGIAVLDGQLLVTTIRSCREDGLDAVSAVVEGARRRLRPVLATSITDALGFLPMALSTGVGAEVQRPLATVVVAGVISSTALTLIVLPVLYYMTRSHSAAQESSASPTNEA